MKKVLFLLIFLFYPLITVAQSEKESNMPTKATIKDGRNKVEIFWQNPKKNFNKIILFRSTIPIEDYFSYEAVEGLCDKIYNGQDESYTDDNLAENLYYYYILFSQDKNGYYSRATVLEKKPYEEKNKKNKPKFSSLAGVSTRVVNEVSLHEAGIVYNYNKPITPKADSASRRLALFIIVKSPHSLTTKDKNAISYFIASGTPTTIVLGSGERAGVLDSYLSVFAKLPRSLREWQDIIKIANGRWPDERNPESEKRAANIFFGAIYNRSPNLSNPYDNAAVTVIAYGLRPAKRNLASEKKAIEIYTTIFKKPPLNATDWDLVRAIAYSGATR